ncbi:hypothetical protein N9M08_07555 [Porticoccaceae bacterium]|nr:hypothetical protein [Porticoccaceae bacterium]MDB2634132.1 hypothetical protein [Porticoccaceae bacterium]MDB2664976.1 hypothetical protein [Porticoccaceae bacterium]
MSVKTVRLAKHSDVFQLLVDEQPFYIKGAGLELGSIQQLAAFGGNAFRTWRVENGDKTGIQILNEAHACGLMVCMGLDIARERHGFDYDDPLAVAKQLDKMRDDVLALKDHPALLMWGIGNELNLRHKNPKVWDAVNNLSKMIHREDPNHPTTTMLAGADPDIIQLVSKRCPDLDLLSFQLYGDINKLPSYLTKSGYNGAYVISEWGATGHWEVETTRWGRPIEANSTLKARDYKQRYLDYIAADQQQCIGSFVFLWGQKQERTPTWYGVFLDNGRHTEAAQIMSELWTGEPVDYPVAQIDSLTIIDENQWETYQLKTNQIYTAEIISKSVTSALTYRWQLMKEVDTAVQSDGGDFEPTPEIIWQKSGTDIGSKVQFKAPASGEYRLFVYLDDDTNGSATANMPVLVD